MKKYFLVVALVISCCVNAQKNKKDTNYVDLDKLTRQIDSSNRAIESASNSVLKKIKEDEMERFNEQNTRNLDAFMQMQKEREAQQKKALYIRLAFGAVAIGVIVFGLIRRKKKQVQ